MTMTLLMKRACRLLVNASLTLAIFLPAHAADPIIGQATVIDGDTIDIRGQRIRLSGMDAFETRQLCQDAVGKAYRCGRDAAFALDDFVGRRNVTCEPNGKHWDRVVAICTVDGDDLGGWMVRQGHAVDEADCFAVDRDAAFAISIEDCGYPKRNPWAKVQLCSIRKSRWPSVSMPSATISRRRL